MQIEIESHKSPPRLALFIVSLTPFHSASGEVRGPVLSTGATWSDEWQPSSATGPQHKQHAE